MGHEGHVTGSNMIKMTELKAAFEEDLKSCVELEAKEWKKKYTFGHRVVDMACYLISGQL